MKSHALRKIAPKKAAGLVDDLKEQLSITSAEELVSFAALFSEKIEKVVGEGRRAQWLILHQKALSVIPPDVLKHLQAPAADIPVTSAIFCGPSPTKFGRFIVDSHITKIRR
jgi:hypothetical protein